MSKNTYPLKLPTSVKKAAAELAATDGVSLNQFIAAAVAEKVGSCAPRTTSCVNARERRNPRTCSSICVAHRRWHRTQTICRRATIDKASLIMKSDFSRSRPKSGATAISLIAVRRDRLLVETLP